MIALLQRASQASVVVDGQTLGSIGTGLMVLVCAERHDTPAEADALLKKLLAYRVFSDEAGKMNRSVADVQGGLLLDRAGGRPPTVRPFCRPGESQARRGGDRSFRRRHASVANQ